MFRSSKYNEKTEKYIYVKKAICLKDGTIFDFMIYLFNNKSEVVKSPLLDISELEVKRYNDTNSEITQAEFDFIESLLRDNCIEGYTLSFPSDNTSDLFLLIYNSLLYYPLCDQKYINENAYII